MWAGGKTVRLTLAGALLSVILLLLGLQLLNRRARNENHNHILALSSLAFFTSLALIKDFLFLPQHCVLLPLGPVKHTINCPGSVWVYQKKVFAAFLSDIANGETICPAVVLTSKWHISSLELGP